MLFKLVSAERRLFNGKSLRISMTILTLYSNRATLLFQMLIQTLDSHLFSITTHAADLDPLTVCKMLP